MGLCEKFNYNAVKVRKTSYSNKCIGVFVVAEHSTNDMAVGSEETADSAENNVFQCGK
jgi:hypothetical protein